jgi:hypothetical protein
MIHPGALSPGVFFYGRRKVNPVLLCHCCQHGDTQKPPKHNGIPFQKSLHNHQCWLQRRRLLQSVSKLADGGSVRFALLVAQPLEGYEAWGANAEGQSKPFRFDFEPTREDVIEELGEYEPREGRGGPGTVDVKFFIAAPVYNFDSGSVQVMSLTQKSIIKELDQISQMDDYDDLLAWDFNLSKKGSGLLTEYTLRPVPRKKGSQEHIDAAWIEARAAGFDISRLLTGGNPFKAA